MKKALLIAIALMIMTPSWAQSWSKDLEKKAKSGDVAAQVAIGNTYLNGDGVEKNLKKATKWFYLAAKAGNKEAENTLLSFHSKELEKYAKEGNAEAQFCVGEFYYNGTDVEKDLKKAAQWYNMAVAQEHEKARTKLLSFYSKELEKLAKSGDAQAQYEVGMDYFEGNGVKKNTETAAKWFYKAKLQGHEDAKIKYYSFFSKYLESNASKDLESLYTVGSFYFDGNGVDKNEKKGFKYLKKAYESGHPLAMDKMGTRYTKSLKKMALTWYSSIKNTDATYQLACCYFYGRGVPVDKGYAISVLSTLSKMGHEKSKDLFYSIDCPERNSRATTYVINKTLKINGFSDWNGLSLSDNLGKTMTVKRNVITSEEKNFINSLDHPNKTEFISVDLGDMSYFVGNTTIDNHDYYVTYQGVLLFIPQKHSNHQNNNNINNSDVIFCKGGVFNLFEQGHSNPIMTTSIDSYMCGDAPYKGSISTTSDIPLLSSINGIDIIPQKNVKKTRNQTLELPLNENSYQDIDQYSFGTTTIDTKELNEKGKKYYNSKNYAEAVKCYILAAEMGNADAQNNIGDCYYEGEGVSQDYRMALNYYSKAGQQGHADAQCNIGHCFYSGKGVQKNYDKALMWYQRAADQGNDCGQYNLGECYIYGYGVSKDYSEALKWYKKSASQGNDDAMLSIGWLYGNGYGVTKDYKEAVKWYTKAADKGNANAIHNLATCYRYGNGVTKSTAKAKELYKKAIALNYKNAQSELNEMEREEKEALRKKKQAEENKAYIIKHYGKDQWALIEKIADGKCSIFTKGIKKSLLENEFLSQMGAYLVYVRGSLYGDLYYVKKNGYTQMKLYFKNGRLVRWE